jgi:hypothetical protein
LKLSSWHVERGVLQSPLVKSQISSLLQVNPHWSVPPQPSEIGPHRPAHDAVAVEGTQGAASAADESALEPSVADVVASVAPLAASVDPSLVVASPLALPSPLALASLFDDCEPESPG